MRLVSIAPLIMSCCVVLLSWRDALAHEESIQVDTVCPSLVLPGHRELGFGAEKDESCVPSDTECFAQTCRFCQEVENKSTKYYKTCVSLRNANLVASTASAVAMLEAAAYTSAPLTNDQCASRVSTGDKNAGISAVHDSTCANGGLGCFGTERCKYCRLSNSLQNQGFKTCSELIGGDSGTSTPTPSTTPSTTTAISTTQTGCVAAVTKSGLQSVSFVTETLCQTNARLTGCVAASTCRLCRSAKNEDNQFLVSCKVLRDQQLTASDTTVITVASTADGDSGRATSSDLSAVGISTAAGFVLALAAIAIKSSRARRVADASVHTPSGHPQSQLQRADSILHIVGRDRIAQL